MIEFNKNCYNCEYEDTSNYDEPCSSCKRSKVKDNWQPAHPTGKPKGDTR